MASGQRRDWLGVVALVSGVVFVLLGGLVVLSYVAGLVTSDSEVIDNVSGFVILTGLTVGPGIALVRRGRRGRRDEAGSPPSEEDALVELRRSARSDRARFWRHVGIGSAIAIAAIVVAVVATVTLGLPPTVPGLIAAGGAGLAIGVLGNRGSKPTKRVTTEVRFENASVRFSNIAFSERRPTMLGWRRDVGVLTVQADSIVIEGLSGQRVVVTAPFAAELHSQRFMYWMMVRLTGGGSEHPRTVYLVVRGAPRSKFAATPPDIVRESTQLVEAINGASRRSA